MSHSLNFPKRVPQLATDTLTLREMTEEDVPAWFERASDPESSRLSGDPIPESVDVCRGWLEVHRDLFRRRKGIRWAVVPEPAGASVGSIGFSNISASDRSAELGGVISRAWWNRGIATAAARLVLCYGFDDLGLLEVRADFVEGNAASKRVLEKLGFRFQHEIENYQEAKRGYLYVLRKPDLIGIDQ